LDDNDVLYCVEMFSACLFVNGNLSACRDGTEWQKQGENSPKTIPIMPI
jgi:hypothetical protein